MNEESAPPAGFSPVAVEQQEPPHRLNLTGKKKVFAIIAALLVLAGLLYFYSSQRGLAPRREYSQTFTLVQDKVSQSAAIVVNLPKGVNVAIAEAAEKISFDPEIKGKWEAGQGDRELVFHPAAKLGLGSYYTVILAASETKLEKDFLVDEDPRVEAVFPAADSEAPEKSDITIVFNRPMVPLTTLDNLLQSEDLPVEISPPTRGKFKWITTRNLQFIPEKRLQRSTHYTVAVKSGFVSMDGLPVSSLTHRFTTRPLRYEGERIHHDGLTLYNEPIRIQFNQPVDLERTKTSIRVWRNDNRAEVPVAVEYGKRRVYDRDTKQDKEYLDRSALNVYGAKDRHGREKFWDFNTVYNLSISGAQPAEGDIALNEGREAAFSVPEVIAGIAAESPRSRFAEPDIFDPEGKLWVTFYEDIDKDSSSIRARNLAEISYGEKCRTDSEGNIVYLGGQCEKETDFKKLSLKFKPDGFGRGEEIAIEFSRIVNRGGLKLNAEKLVKTIRTYPKLAVLGTFPADGDRAGELTELKLCTNTPLAPAKDEEFLSQVKSNLSVGRWNWYEPFRVKEIRPGIVCNIGEFQNTIRYGLVPESAYRLDLKVKDDFGQPVEKTVAFRSEAIESVYRRLNHLQKVYNVTSPDRTKLTYAAENLEYVNVHLCKTSALAFLGYVDSEKRPDQTLPGENFSCEKSVTKRIELARRYWTPNYFQVNLRDLDPNPLGHYILSFGHPEYRAERFDYNTQRYVRGSPIYERTFITVTNLAVQEKKIERSEDFYYSAKAEPFPSLVEQAAASSGGNLYWVTRVGSLDAVSAARVDVYQKRGKGPLEAVGSVLTDGRGIARQQTTAPVAASIVYKDGDSAIVSSQLDKFQWTYPVRSAERTYIYTDRPIYRPGQEVFIKGLYRIGYDGDYEIFRGKSADLKVFNSRGEEAFKSEAEISDYGTFTASFILDSKAPLGTYRIEALGGYYYFDVEEYVPASFKVDLKSPREEYIAGDTLELNVEADYYFGVPVEGGEVEYSILAQNYYFDRYQDDYFRFDAGWYYDYGGRYGDTFILRDKTALDGRGMAKIERKLDFDKFFREEERSRSKIFIVRATVKNSSGQAVSQEKSFIVHRGEFYLGASLKERYFAKGEPNELRLKSVDTKGKALAVSGIQVEVAKIKWESFKRREVDGRFYYRWEKKKEVIKSFTARTDSEGDFREGLKLDQEGEYEITARAADGRGNPIMATTDFYVYGSSAVSVRPTNNETLDLAVEKNQLNVGESAKIIIKSPYQRAKALVSIERGKIFDYTILDIDRNLADWSFTAREEHIPNVYVSVLLLSPRPEVKFGQVNFRINAKEKELSISAKPSKNHYLPGEKVTLDVETRAHDGRPVAAEVSVAVVDMSVLALKGNPKKTPVTFFYDGMPLGVTTASNVKNILYEAEIPTGTKGGGGLEAEDLARKKRGTFRETAFWQGVVRTGQDGRVSVSFTLPDNLTTWQTELVGITKDTKLGAGYGEFTARKELMVVPLKPRFVIPGDEFMIGAKIFNQTNSSQRLEVTFTSSTLEAKGNTKESTSIKAGDSKTVYFAVRAPDKIQDGSHSFVVSAKNQGYEDTVENTVTIRRNDTYEAVATAHSTSELKAREYVFLPDNIVKDKGGVTVKSSATLAVFLSDALNYLVAYPYGCSEQIASKLSSIAIVKRGLNLKNVGENFQLKDVEFEGQKYTIDDVVEIGLARIYSNQAADGGFTYYPDLPPNFYLTLHIVNTLEDLRRAGYNVNADVIRRAGRFLYNEIVFDPYLSKSNETVILTAYALSRIDGFQAENDFLRSKIITIANDKKYVREDISNLALAHLAIVLAAENYPASLKSDTLKTLENRITIDGRGASLKPSAGGYMFEYYETPIKDTAFLLKALVVNRRESPINDKILRWLLRSRARDGAWGSTNNSLAVVEAFTEYLEWKRETESAFDLELLLDGKSRAKFEFNPETILKTFELFLPTSDFTMNAMNLLDFSKKNRNSLPNAFYYDMLLQYFLPIDAVPPRDEGFAVMREFYRRDDDRNETPLYEAKVGDVLKGHLTIVLPKARNFVAVEDFIPAGMELVNLKLATEDQSLLKEPKQYYGGYDEFLFNGGGESKTAAGAFGSGWPGLVSGLKRSFGNLTAFISFRGFGSGGELDDDEYSPPRRAAEFIPDAEEAHDDRLFLFKERAAAGVYEFDYFVRALIPGKYHHLPAVASEMYFPENFGRTRGEYFEIKQ